jgi:flagellar hook protein FlgE
MEIASIALQGMERAQAHVEQAAGRLASIGANSSESSPVDTVDLSQEVLALLAAKNDFAANVATLKIANQIQKQTVNLLA